MKSTEVTKSVTMNPGSPAAPKSANPLSQTPTKAKKSRELPVVGLVGGVKLEFPAFTAPTASSLATSSEASELQAWKPKAPTPMKKSPSGIDLPMKGKTAIAAVTHPLTFGETVAQTPVSKPLLRLYFSLSKMEPNGGSYDQRGLCTLIATWPRTD